MRYQINILSPVHIGTGTKLELFDYLIVDDRFYRIDLDKFLRRLSELPEAVEKFTAWVETTSTRLAQARNDRERADLRRDFNLHWFCLNHLRNPSLIKELTTSYYLYQGGCPPRLWHRKVLELIKLSTSQPLIPGSSLKGALRTAMAYHVLQDNSHLWRDIYNGLPQTDIRGARHETRPKIVGKSIEQVVFGCGFRGFRRGRELTIYGDAKYDLFKLLFVSDTLEGDSTLRLEPTATLTFDRFNKSLRRPFYLDHMEVIAPHSRFQLDISLDKNLLSIFKQSQRRTEWLGLEEKFRRLFGLHLSELQQKSTEDTEAQILKHLFEAIELFSHAAIKAALTWLSQGDSSTAIQGLQAFYNSLEEKKGLLHLGMGSGWDSTTIGLLMKERFPADLQQLLSRGVIKTRGRPTAEEFPRSRRLVSSGRDRYQPLGWIQLVPI